MDESYRKHLKPIAAQDAVEVEEKDKQYGASWLAYGGLSAFFAAVRKWDRILVQLKKVGYDVFKGIEADRRVEGIIDDIRDFRRYLLLWEAEAVRQGLVDAPVAKLTETDETADLREKADRAKREMEAILAHLKDVYRALGCKWGTDIFDHIKTHVRFTQGDEATISPPALGAAYGTAMSLGQLHHVLGRLNITYSEAQLGVWTPDGRPVTGAAVVPNGSTAFVLLSLGEEVASG